MRRMILSLLLALPLLGQAYPTYRIPVWTVPAAGAAGYWLYLDASPILSCSGNPPICSIRVQAGPIGPVAPPNVWVLNAPQPTFTLHCVPAMVYRDGVLQNSGVGVVSGSIPSDYTLSGLVATFGAVNPGTIPQAGDVVLAVYLCGP